MCQGAQRRAVPDLIVDTDDTKPAAAQPSTSAAYAKAVPPPKKKGVNRKRGALTSVAAREKREKAIEREDRLRAKAARKETRQARNQAGRSE